MILDGANFGEEREQIMKTPMQTITSDLGALADDARALIAATADVAEEKVCEARKRLEAALDSGKRFYDRVRDRAEDGAEAACDTVRDHPYQAIGIGVGVGALVGYLLANRGTGRRR